MIEIERYSAVSTIPERTEIEALARQAGAILRAGYGKHHQVTTKTTAIDLVTEMDHLSEAYLVEALQTRYPGDRIITEEQGDIPGNDQRIWYIDPLDGTVNYAHHIPHFCVSVAFMSGGMLRLGVVYDPMHDDCFSAERGGAWLNGQPIRVGAAQTLDESLLVTGFPYNVRTNPGNLEYYRRFALRSQGVRRLGSAALDLCYVAAGRFDGYWEFGLGTWDIAAGVLIAEEAGAKVTRADGSAGVLAPPPTVLAANPLIHAQMLAVLSE